MVSMKISMLAAERRPWVGLLLAILALGCHASGAEPDTSPPRPGLRILPLGDSITEAPGGAASYRYWLEKELDRKGVAFDYVGSKRGVYRGKPKFDDFDSDHEGRWGWTTADVRVGIDGWAAKARADIVLLHLGTNDLARDLEPNLEMIENLKAIFGALRRANPKVVILLARIIPMAGFPTDRWRAANDRIEKLGRELTTPESPIVVVRQDEGFDAEADTADGAHPNESGEKKMAARWLGALEPVIAARRSIGP